MEHTSALPRQLSYLALAALLALVWVLLQDSDRAAGPDLHTMLEVSATVLALCIGLVWLARQRIEQSNDALVVAIGFIGTALLDATHAVVTSEWFSPLGASPPTVLLWSSWSASRTLLALVLLLSWWLWYQQSRGQNRQWPAWSIVAAVGALSLVFAVIPALGAPTSTAPFGRPAEIAAAVGFLIALVAYARKNAWRRDHCEHGLMLSLVAGLFCEVFMASSAGRFDAMFSAAHMLKLASYGLIFAGMLASTAQAFERVTSTRTRGLEGRRKEIESRLQAAEEQYHTMVEANLEPLCINFDAKLVYVNQAFVELFGFEDRANAIGLPLASIITADDLAMIDERRNARLRGEDVPSRYVARFERPDGSVLAAEISNAPIEYDGRPSVLTSFHDLTEREEIRKSLEKTASELARSNAELEHFAFVASHDLQEPLRKIQAFGDRLRVRQADALSEQGLDYLNRMLNATARMRALIENLLTYGRVATNAQPFVPVDLDEVLANVTSDLQLRIEQEGAHIDSGKLPTIDADPSQMRQLMQNLIGNALKFRREEATPVIKIRGDVVEHDAHGSRGTHGFCRISVEDNGIGFEQEYGDRIFQIFQRLHARSQYEGTGIGLAISRRIVERHSGQVTADSNPGSGSTFTITLPIRQTDQEGSQCSSPVEPSQSPSYLPRTMKKIA